MKSDKKLIIAVSWFLFLLLLNYSVPYTILLDISEFNGSFLFWTLLSIISIGSMIFMMSRWRLEDE